MVKKIPSQIPMKNKTEDLSLIHVIFMCITVRGVEFSHGL
jgi:hypothetical protein